MFYIIYGDDNYRCYDALAKIKAGLGSPETIGINTSALDGRKLTLKELSEVCDAVPFMSANRLVIVEGLLKRFQGSEKQSRLRGIDNSNSDDGNSQLLQDIPDYIKTMPQTTTLVMFEADLDIRTTNQQFKMLLPVADKVLQFNELKGKELIEWIRAYVVQHGGKMTAMAANLLANYVGGDLWMMVGEINKLIAYCDGREITESDIKVTTSYAREDNIFDLVDSILEGRNREAQYMLHRMLKYGIAPQQILTMIERQLTVIMRVKDIEQGTSIQEIRERLALHPKYPVDKAMKQARAFPISRLRKSFHCLLNTDVAIKTGKYEDELAFDLMIIELCKH